MEDIMKFGERRGIRIAVTEQTYFRALINGTPFIHEQLWYAPPIPGLEMDRTLWAVGKHEGVDTSIIIALHESLPSGNYRFDSEGVHLRLQKPGSNYSARSGSIDVVINPGGTPFLFSPNFEFSGHPEPVPGIGVTAGTFRVDREPSLPLA